MDYCYGGTYRKCNMLAFFCTVFRREVFEEVGYLDPAFKEGLGDDDDLCKRMANANMQCAVSFGTYVFHNHRTTFTSLYTPQELEEMSQDRHDIFENKHGEKATVHAVD